MLKLLLLLLAASLNLKPVTSTYWTVSDTINYSDFFKRFAWYSEPDPTNGLVQFQTMTNSQYSNLSYVNQDQFIMAVETTPTVNVTAGRKSVRITSTNSYSDGIYVLNVSHVPIGCAVWPAFWTVTDNITAWPKGGEIDIAENANDQYKGTLSALHTDGNCIISNKIKSQVGTLLHTNCSAHTSDNAGCQTELNKSKSPSWGVDFNKAGGGIYAMERSLGSTGNGVRVWAWTHNNVPKDLAARSDVINPDTWGKAGAHFDVADNCHSQFGPHNIIFDITLCGAFAGVTYDTVGCNATYPSCSEQVATYGGSFNQSYWAINDLRIFEDGGGTDNAANSPNLNVEIDNKVSSAGRSAVDATVFLSILCSLALGYLLLAIASA